MGLALLKSQSGSDHLHGKVLQRVEAAGLLLSRATYSPGLHLPRHVHRYPFFSLVLRGGFTEIGRKERVECLQSALIFRGAGEEHANQFHGAGAECFRVELGPSWDEPARPHIAELQSSACPPSGPATWLALRLANECHHLDDCSSLVIEGLVLETLGTVARTSKKGLGTRTPKWLSLACEMLRDNFSEPFNATALAAAVGVHPVHLSRAFRRHYGCTMGEYLRQVRIEFACRQLAEMKDPIAQISLDAGFSGQSHFSVAFKRVTGLSPAQYRAGFCETLGTRQGAKRSEDQGRVAPLRPAV